MLSLMSADKPGKPTFAEKWDELYRLFPKAKAFYDWWHLSDVEAMLFKSRRALLADDPPSLEAMDEGLRKDTNPQESMHGQYYMLTWVFFFNFVLT